ncbi:MAG: zinc-ribbon domain containing protein [Symbiobacteriaceae bacterium]|nr:zinc-ribbon domain containing protein [Symbiobacteriaceae bacterium]
MYQDKTLTCRDCQAEFVFSAGEQEFYASRGFVNEPTRCPDCRRARKNQRGEGGSQQREMFEAVCANCGAIALVPFRPSGDRPVYCADCYQPRPRY